MTVTTADEIELFGYRTLAEILASVRGFYTSCDRGYTLTGVRGLNRPGDFDTRILVIIDGQKANDAVYNAVSGSEHLLDVELIDRVEIIRGPSSSLYGTSVFFAVVTGELLLP